MVNTVVSVSCTFYMSYMSIVLGKVLPLHLCNTDGRHRDAHAAHVHTQTGLRIGSYSLVSALTTLVIGSLFFFLVGWFFLVYKNSG